MSGGSSLYHLTITFNNGTISASVSSKIQDLGSGTTTRSVTIDTM